MQHIHPITKFRASRKNGRGRPLSQKALAEQVGVSGVLITRIETGKQFASLSLALKLQEYSGGKIRAEQIVSPANRKILKTLQNSSS